ncbi:hypothetical protein PJ311_07155 [Bacillus sp. CLL-7-23]|uniref:Uncharacterized protein n=1 Tax=Bacillus changyiensis TaxID=3004103 RepID=A0ABT4X2A2_9BACI|nr:hypothetical protein [Bacillus changyiensis]MDA7026394.1 hypothetical protein [Bacillus changyiensis]
MKKRIIGVLILAFCLLTFNTASNATATPNEKSVEQITIVLDSAWEKFGMFGYQIIETDSTISMGIDKKINKVKLREYLNENLPEEAKEKYEIDIFQKDINILKREHRLESLN